jgi:asparagine synthase (glutamine-hydrolysing)
MCGICGILTTSHRLSPEKLRDAAQQMNDELRHRGPDDEGLWASTRFAMAMRRLAIIDVGGGHQPITNEDGTLVIVLNGEIYNYQELRAELIRAGHKFKTHSDTEVVLHLYEEHGDDTPKLLKGMFAFCIADTQSGTMFFARDRFGEKPLFYYQAPEFLAFSSELHSLVQLRQIPRRLNHAALPYFLRYGFVPCPWTMYRDVMQLPPAHWMKWQPDGIEIERYWQLDARPDPSIDEVTAKELVRNVLLRSVSRQRISDVPVGAFLSGGIDSSTIVAALQRQSGKPVPTFTAKFENARYDESPIARKVAEFLGTDHHELVIPNQSFQEEDLFRIVRHVGQPFADSSAIPTYQISRRIRDYVTVCLSGDGGDEMFAGYNYFVDCLRVDGLVDRIPEKVFPRATSLANALATAPLLRTSTRLRQLRQVCSLGAISKGARPLHVAPLFDPDELDDLLQPEFTQWLDGEEDDSLAEYACVDQFPSRLRQLMAYRSGFGLSEDMLVKVDRMSMATSLEVRAPMLDPEVCETAARFPDELLIRGRTTKFILREAVRDWLPPEVFSHPKWGFSIPLHDYQNARYAALCHDMLLNPSIDGIMKCFTPAGLRRIVNRGLTRRRDQADVSVYRATHQVWALLQLSAWADTYGVSV